MVTEAKINDVLDYYEVKSGVNTVFGNWVVSNEGDIINVEFTYPIYSAQLNYGYERWHEHLEEKTWYDATVANNFKLAFDCAIKLAK